MDIKTNLEKLRICVPDFEIAKREIKKLWPFF
jgi:hypothetical protein